MPLAKPMLLIQRQQFQKKKKSMKRERKRLMESKRKIERNIVKKKQIDIYRYKDRNRRKRTVIT